MHGSSHDASKHVSRHRPSATGPGRRGGKVAEPVQVRMAAGASWDRGTSTSPASPAKVTRSQQSFAGQRPPRQSRLPKSGSASTGPLASVTHTSKPVSARTAGQEVRCRRASSAGATRVRTKLPKGKILLPGVVTHSTNIIKHPELVAWRVMNFARLVGRENVITGTDCGFSQFWNLIRTYESIQRAQLEALTEGAPIAPAQASRV
jgi:hypothetical protein